MAGPYSNEVKEFTIEPGCPWYDWQQTYGAPNVNWCEPTQCSLINEPANTWSNLGYIIFGLLLIRKLKKSPINVYPYLIVFIGFVSGFYHATNNYLTQYFDFLSMFFMMAFLSGFAIKRLFRMRSSFWAIFWCLVFLNTLAFQLFGILDLPVQWIMLTNMGGIIVIETLAGIRDRILNCYRYFVPGVIFILTAQAASIMDIQRVYCEPENIWIHGHVLWHILASIGLYLAGLHLKEVQSRTDIMGH